MRVLIIEDFSPLRKALIQGLQESGYVVDATGDGNEGWWYAQSNPYDVIVLDLMLPGMDGLTLLRRLRETDSKAHVLILTARDELEDRVIGLESGADDYLVKPFAFAELLARVRRGYDRKSPILRVGDLEIDTRRRVARRYECDVELTAREYALLEFLAMRAGEVITRTEIWEHLYAFHNEAQSNVVDVYIGYLRKKLEVAGRPRLIHTRRGQGYVLEEGPR